MKSHTICGPAGIVLALLSPAALAQDKAAEPATTATVEPAATAAKTKAKTEAKTEAQLEAKPAAHPFTAMAGSWSGGGTISLSGGTRERLRCRATHIVGGGNKSLAMSIRCASDSYRFELSSSVVERRGQIFGKWSEASNGVSGSISGRAAGNRISGLARGDSFSAGISVTTNGNRQSVSITPQGVHITGVQIALSRH